MKILDETDSSPVSILLMVDDDCRRNLRKRLLKAEELRSIQGYLCCKHVAYARYTCNHKVFVYDKQDGDHRSFIPFKCPLDDGGRVYKNTRDEKFRPD